MDVVIAVLLNLKQERELRQALGGEGLQERTILLWTEKDFFSSDKNYIQATYGF